MSTRLTFPTGQGGRTLFETILMTSLIGVLIFFAISNFLVSEKLVRVAALRIELSNIRTSIILYTTVNRRYPKSLKALAEESYLIPSSEGFVEGRYLAGMSVDGKGNILDTFGAPFNYDTRSGRVSSSSKGYEYW